MYTRGYPFFSDWISRLKKYIHRESNPDHNIASLRVFAMRGSVAFYH